MATEAPDKTASESIEEWAREHGAEFRGKDVAEYLNIPPNTTGPILSAMVRAGTLRRLTKGNKNVYQAAPQEKPDVADLADPEFVPNLRDSLIDYLHSLHEELTSLDERRQSIDSEANRTRAALKELS